MKKVTFVSLLVLVASSFMWGDQITFSFVYTSTTAPTFKAETGGVTLGPASNVLITDNTKNISLPLSGIASLSTGPSTSFITLPDLLIASFSAGGTDSISITSGSTTLLSGIINDHASVVSTFPAGAGSFLGTFTVTFVNPSIFAKFGLAPVFDPTGSVSSTYAGANLVNTRELDATGGGGAVTITAPQAAVVPESATLLLGLAGLVLTVVFTIGRKVKA